MLTRSQTRYINNALYALYKVEIDFDEASFAWKANKKCVRNGTYKYICTQKFKNGNQCKRESLDGIDCCKMHNAITHNKPAN
jgi:hypothetical protein